jgi:hypothetical protein
MHFVADYILVMDGHVFVVATERDGSASYS